MKNTCSQYLFLFLLSLSTSPPLPVEASIERLRWVHIPPNATSWHDARRYCKFFHGGPCKLASKRKELDVSWFSDICAAEGGGDPCWVGLEKKEDNVWRWKCSNKTKSPSVLPWTGDNQDKLGCGALKNNQLYDYRCPSTLKALCENNHLVLVKKEKTWEEALHFCRALQQHADLLSFQDEEELSFTQDEMARAQTEEVWIGLRWLAGRWLWMDRTAGGTISLAECPANGTHCGTLSGGGQHARNCMEKRRFFCLKLA